MHYLLIIKIKARINRPGRIATFVSSKAGLSAFCVLPPQQGLLAISLGQSVPFESGAGNRVGKALQQCGTRKHLNLAQVQQENRLLLVSHPDAQ